MPPWRLGHSMKNTILFAKENNVNLILPNDKLTTIPKVLYIHNF